MTSHDASKCTCAGPWCTCDGKEVLKDGASFRISMMVRDAEPEKDTAMTPNHAIDHLADGSACLKFKDGSSVVAYPSGQKVYFDLAGNPAKSLTLEQLAFSQGTAQVVDEAADKLVSAQEYEHRIANAWR